MDNNLNNQEDHKDHGEINPYLSMSPVTAAFLALAAVFILYQFGGALLTFAIFGLEFEKADVNSVRLLTMGGQILFILLPALLFARFVYSDVTSALRVNSPSIKGTLLFIGGMIILTPLLQSFLYIQNFIIDKLAANSSFINTIKNFIDQIDEMVQSTYGNLLHAGSLFEASFIVFVVAVIPALCEETFFRGFVQKSFEHKFKPVWSILLTSIFFGIYHFNPYGLIALIALGIYFGFAAYISNSIFIPMILHFLNNFFAVSAYLILGDEELISSNITPDNDILFHIVSFLILSLIFSIFIYYTKRNYHKFRKKEEEL